MAKTLTTSLAVASSWKHTNVSHQGIRDVPDSKIVERSYDFTNGTAADQCDRHFAKRYSIAGAATENIDLAASLTDAFGEAITFVKIKLIRIVNRSAENSSPNAHVSVKPGGSNPFNGPFSGTTPALQVPADGELLVVRKSTGWTVTAGTGDILALTNEHATETATVDLILEGTSA